MSVETNFTKTTKKPHTLLVLICLFLGLAFLIGYIIYKNHQNAADSDKKFDQNKKPKTVTIGYASKEDMDVSLNALGTVTSRNTVLVQSLVGGQLMSVHFKEGDSVKKGQLLAVVDERPYKIQLSQAEGQFIKDKALLDNAKLDLNRYKLEFSAHAIPKQTLDTQFAIVKQDEATLKIDQAQVDNAKLQLSYCKITSPVDGMVGMRLIDPGNIIQQNGSSTIGSGIVNVVQINPITVVFSIPEDQLPNISDKLRTHQKIVAEIYDRNNQKLLAQSSLIAANALIDTSTGTIQLKATFDNQDVTLFPNQFVNVRLLIDTIKEATVAPLAAIQKGRKGDYVYVVDDQKRVHVRPVKVGVTSGEKIVISEGLNPNETVVVDGADKLKDGAVIRPIIPKNKPKSIRDTSTDANATKTEFIAPQENSPNAANQKEKEKVFSSSKDQKGSANERDWSKQPREGKGSHWRHQGDQGQ